MRISDWSSDVCSSDLIVLAHVRLGILGAIARALVFGLMSWLGVRFIVSSPRASGPVLVGFGGLAGLLLGGLVSLPPDHVLYIQPPPEAMEERRPTFLETAFSWLRLGGGGSFIVGRGCEGRQ